MSHHGNAMRGVMRLDFRSCRSKIERSFGILKSAYSSAGTCRFRSLWFIAPIICNLSASLCNKRLDFYDQIRAHLHLPQVHIDIFLSWSQIWCLQFSILSTSRMVLFSNKGSRTAVVNDANKFGSVQWFNSIWVCTMAETTSPWESICKQRFAACEVEK